MTGRTAGQVIITTIGNVRVLLSAVLIAATFVWPMPAWVLFILFVVVWAWPCRWTNRRGAV